MTRLLLACGIAIGLATFAGPLLAQNPPPSDHYLSYRVEPRTLGVGVLVEDQFLPEFQVGVSVLERLLNPVRQDGSPYIDPTAHLDWWRIDPHPDVDRRIGVINKFGTFEWHVSTLEFLLVPSRKNTPGQLPPDNINHFLCYRAQGPPPDRQVFLDDQFQSFATFVGPPEYFCNPCRKNHDGREYPIVDPNVHLAVYHVDPPPFSAAVLLRDQFGEFQTVVGTQPPEFLFVPSLKDEPVPVESRTWGAIKSIYR